MSEKKALGVAVFDTGLAMAVYYSLNGFIGNFPAGAVMLLVLGVILYVQGSELDDETPEEKVLGESNE